METAGYSATPLAQKLGIRSGMTVAVLHGPPGVDDTLGELPEGVTLQKGVRREQKVDLILGFVKERQHLAANIGWLVKTLEAGGAFWVAWPKRASKVPTDMSDHAIREIALPLGWVDVKVCAIDPTWSALKLVLRKEPKPRPA